MKLKLKFFVGLGALFSAIKAIAGGWLIAFVVVTVAIIAGVTAWQSQKWKVKLENIQQKREQSFTNEDAQLFIPSGVVISNAIIVEQFHRWEWDTNDVVSLSTTEENSSSVVWEISTPQILRPVVSATLSTTGIVLSVSSDALWTTSSISVMDQYGVPRTELVGTAPTSDVAFDLERSSDLVNWTKVIRMGSSSNTPAVFRDIGATWGNSRVFYRARR